MGKKKKKLPKRKLLRQLFNYYPESGRLVWRVSRKGIREDGMVGAVNNVTGYREAMVDGEKYRVHRLIWKLETGRDPKEEIDHINGCCSDNRLCNLREATRLENANFGNRKIYKNSTSGVTGVTWAGTCWLAQIHVNKKIIRLYYGPIFEDAVQARVEAEIMYRG